MVPDRLPLNQTPQPKLGFLIYINFFFQMVGVSQEKVEPGFPRGSGY